MPTVLRRTGLALAAVLLAPVITPAAAGTVAAPAAAGRGCGQGSWVAGTVDLCRGELVYRDYVYDDHGSSAAGLPDQRLEGLYAAVRPTHDGWGNISPAGAADYLGQPPDSRDNTADLVALRMRVTRSTLKVTAELNTLVDPGTATVVLGIDTDRNARTGSGPSWPGGLIANPFQQRPLLNKGLDKFVSLTGGNSTSNLLTATVPRPRGSTWRLQAVVARELPGSPAPVVMNVGFRGVDERGGWWESAQADALVDGDISAFTHTVRVADLDRKLTRRAVVKPGKLRQRVYISRYNPGAGEGIDHDGGTGGRSIATQGFTHVGKYQPYGFYQPKRRGPHELQLLLHGAGENHSTQMWDPAEGRNPPPVAKAFDRSNRIFASPLSRGPRGWYSSYSERDVLDVLADVKKSYPIIDDRVVLSGTSMGGYGTMRIASLHPEKFAAALPWVGPTGDTFSGTPLQGRGVRAQGNVLDFFGNLRHVPIAAWYAGADELVQVNQALAVRDRLAELKLPSMWWLHMPANHSSPATINDWAKEAAWSAGRKRVKDPARVSFRTDQRFYFPEAGVRPDGAYWVSDIDPAADGFADVDAISYGCGYVGRKTVLTTPNGSEPVPWVGQQIKPAKATAGTPRRELRLTLSNVAALTVDTGDRTARAGAREACLGDRAMKYRVRTDRPVKIRFTDGRRLTLPAGTHDGRLPA